MTRPRECSKVVDPSYRVTFPLAREAGEICYSDFRLIIVRLVALAVLASASLLDFGLLMDLAY